MSTLLQDPRGHGLKPGSRPARSMPWKIGGNGQPVARLRSFIWWLRYCSSLHCLFRPFVDQSGDRMRRREFIGSLIGTAVATMLEPTSGCFSVPHRPPPTRSVWKRLSFSDVMPFLPTLVSF